MATFLRSFLGILSIVALAVLASLAGGIVQAQDPTPVETAMISNAGQSHVEPSGITRNFEFGQQFCTGPAATTLKKVRLFASDPVNQAVMNPRVSLHANGSGNSYGGRLATLTNPSSYDSSFSTGDDFTTSGHQLAANTSYWVVVKDAGDDPYDFFWLSMAGSKKTDDGWATGWALGRSTAMNGNPIRMTVFTDSAAQTHFPARYPRGCGESGPSFSFSVDEDESEDTVVGSVAATSHDGDTLTYSVTGTDADAFNELFTIDSAGQVKVKTGADLEITEPYYAVKSVSYRVTVEVTDGEDESGDTETSATADDSASLAVRVRNLRPAPSPDQPGTVTFSPEAPVSGSYLTATVTDPDRVLTHFVPFDNEALFYITGNLALLRWQWSRGDTADGSFVDIEGANPSTKYASSKYMPTAADVGKFLRATVIYVDTNGLGKSAEATASSAVTAASQQSQGAPENRPAQGAPTITGTVRAGETLSVDSTAISDLDGMERARFSVQWLADGEAVEGATYPTFYLPDALAGKVITVTVTFTDDEGNAESLTSAPTAAVAARPPLEPQSAAVNGDRLTITFDEVLDGLPTLPTSAFAVSVDGSTRAVSATEISGTSVILTLGSAVAEGETVTVGYTRPEGNSFIRDTLGRTAESFSGQEVTNNTPPPPLTASARGAPASHDGSATFAYELHFSEAPSIGYETMRDHAFTVTGGSIRSASRLDPPSNAGWRITVEPSGDGTVTLTLPVTTDCEVEGSVCTSGGKKLSAEFELEVPGPGSEQGAQENNAATGAPIISGTAWVGRTLTVSTSDIADADGLTSVSYSYVWLADDAEISGATGSSYTLVPADRGKAVKVRVSFTDDAGNAETLTSAATAAVAPPPLTASASQAPASHDGSSAFTFELRFSEEPSLGYETLRDNAFSVTGGSVQNARRLTQGSNTGWEITVEPSGNGTVTLTLPATADCAATGAICTSDGKMLSAQFQVSVPGPGSPQESQQNSPATGAPAISGTAQVGQTLTVSTSAIADADGLTNASYSYQWLADDVVISGAIGSTYTPAADDQGKAIKVRVSFTDDAGNAESLTSAATAAVAARPNRLVTGAPAISGTAQVGQTLTVSTAVIADADGLTNVSYSYVWLADDAEISGATGSSYTLVAGDQGKAIKVRVSFTDDAGNAESLTSAATAAVVPPPLTASSRQVPASHDGSAEFTFELHFSEEFDLSYVTLRDYAFTLGGGSIVNARRLNPPSNLGWEITVEPSGNGAVTVVLPVTTDCAATGAICTGDGRKLSNRLEFTVSGTV